MLILKQVMISLNFLFELAKLLISLIFFSNLSSKCFSCARRELSARSVFSDGADGYKFYLSVVTYSN